MKYLILTLTLGMTLFASCQQKNIFDTKNYHATVNKAELAICQNEWIRAEELYTEAFEYIDKPFGKDVHNAAICSGLNQNTPRLKKLLQILINNMDEWSSIKTKFVPHYITDESWNELISDRTEEYEDSTRNRVFQINELDQVFRPMYDTHQDTIDRNLKINIDHIYEMTEDNKGFPSHQEIGYTSFWSQPHYIVLHHYTQKRSLDRSYPSLEPLLFDAVYAGRLLPEKAILYMRFETANMDIPYETYAIKQVKHPLLPDSLSQKLWLRNLDEEQKANANRVRNAWLANSLEDIAVKADYIKKNENLPFIFSSVLFEIGNLKDEFTLEEVLEQYSMYPLLFKEYKPQPSMKN